MKTTSVFGLCALIGASALVVHLYAEDKSKASALSGSSSNDKRVEAITRDKVAVALTVRDLLGREVVNSQGQHLGRVEDLVLKGNEGGFDKLIVSSGGFLGIREKLVTVPYEKIEHRPGTRGLIWDIPKDELLTLTGREKKQRESASNLTASKRRTDWEQKGATLLGSTFPKAHVMPATPAEHPVSESTPAADTLRQVQTALASDPVIGSKVGQLKLAIDGDKLVIEGQVDTMTEKRRIIQLADKASEFEIVDNLSVKPSVATVQ